MITVDYMNFHNFSGKILIFKLTKICLLKLIKEEKIKIIH